MRTLLRATARSALIRRVRAPLHMQRFARLGRAPLHMQRFARPVRACAQVARMLEHVQDDFNNYLVLELAPNGTLAGVLKRRKWLTEPEVCAARPPL